VQDVNQHPGINQRRRKNKMEDEFEECAIPKPKLSVTQTFENGDEYYEDENYIGLNGMCAEKDTILANSVGDKND